MSNEKSMSIDEMIASGVSLPEIQKQLTRKVAARDEAKLADARKRAKISDARVKAVDAMLSYLTALGMPCGSEERTMTEDMFRQIEKEMSKYSSIFESLGMKADTKEEKSNEPDDWDWLINMVKNL